MVSNSTSARPLLPTILLVLVAGSVYAQTLEPECRQTIVEGGASVSITWQSTPDPDGNTASWCTTVGPPLIIAPTTPSTNRGESVILASWNINVGGGRIDEFLADVTGRYGNTPVVLLLQEAFRAGADLPPVSTDTNVPARISQPGSSPDIRGAARELGWWAYYVPSMRNGKEHGWQAQDRGNAILSSLPLADFRAFELPFVRERRVAITATVLSRDNKPLFRVASVHFSTGNAEGRARQAEDLSAAIKPLVNSDLPFVLGGDLNTHDTEEPATTLLEGLLRRADCGGRPTMFFGTLLKLLTFGFKDFVLDHLFLSRPVLAQGCVQSGRFQSDHNALLLPLTFSN